MNGKEVNITNDKRAYKQITGDLENLYKNEIYTCESKCIHYSDCFKKAKEKGYNDGWDSDYAAKVGKNYPLQINNKEIRIVIVGKEGLCNHKELMPPARLKGAYNHHYRETYKVLCEMLNYNWDSNGNRNKEEGEYQERPDAVLTAFALTNTYRCAFKKKYEKKTKKGVKKAEAIYRTEEQRCCIEILRKELDILKPTILFIQNAGLTAENLYQGEIFHIHKKEENGIYDFSKHKDKGFYIIQTVHPTCYGRWYYFVKKCLSNIVDYLQKESVLPTNDISAALDELAN